MIIENTYEANKMIIENTYEANKMIIENTYEAKEKFGFNYGVNSVEFTEAEIKALREGKCIAFDINEGEYSLFVTLSNVPATTPRKLSELYEGKVLRRINGLCRCGQLVNSEQNNYCPRCETKLNWEGEDE